MKLSLAVKGVLFFSCGILAASLFNVPFIVSITLVLAGTVYPAYLLASNKTGNLSGLAAVFLFFIGWGYFLTNIGTAPAKPLFQQTRVKDVTAKGEVTETSLQNTKGFSFLLHLTSIEAEDTVLASEKVIKIQVKRADTHLFNKIYSELLPGKKVTVTGDYIFSIKKRNPGEFNYGAYLSGKGISGILYTNSDSSIIISPEKSVTAQTFLTQFRRYLHTLIYSLHSRETAALLTGLLIGERGDINQDMINDFKDSGIIHILAVSGTNVAAVVLILFLLFGRFSFTLKIVLTALGLLLFVLISGASSSVIRAALMAVMLLIGQRLERSTDTLSIVCGSALLILIFDPRQLFDPGFQLSYSAVLSIIILSPPFEKLLLVHRIRNRGGRAVLKIFVVSLAAQIGMMPFVVYYYGQFSLAGLLLNILVIPLSTFLLFNGIITFFVLAVSQHIAFYFAGASELFTFIINYSAKQAAELSYSYIPVPGFTIFAGVMYYLIISLLLAGIHVSSRSMYRITIAISCVLLFVFLYPVLQRNLLPAGKLSVLMIDVGQGDAILLGLPDGKKILVDAGVRTPGYDNGKQVLAPLLKYLGMDKTDILIISHPDMDHIGGAYSLLEMKLTKQIWKNESDTSDRAGRVLEDLAAAKNIQVRHFDDTLIAGNGYRIYLLNNPGETPAETFEKTNEQSCAVKIQYRTTGILLCGDAEAGMEGYLTVRYGKFLESEILKLNHHGSKTSSRSEFLAAVSPLYALISCGENNMYRHPSPKVLSELKKRNIQPVRTDTEGAVLFVSDGKQLSRVQF